MAQIFMPDNNPETPFNTEKVSRKGRKRRIFVADEFYDSGNSKDGKYQPRISIQNNNGK